VKEWVTNHVGYPLFILLEWFNMFTLPKIEKITRDAAITHFFLMFGYKLFSLYFPLFLVAKSFSLPQIGYTNFLIYLPIALFAPLVGFLNHRINPAVLAAVGVLGYGAYALAMILFPNLFIFYLFQAILGISASLFFVSSRAMMMGSKLENPSRAFAWFYSAPFYADAIAPAVGALLIWKFDFIGVFIFSLILQFFNAIFCFVKLKNQTSHLTENVKITESGQNYLKVFKSLKTIYFAGISLRIMDATKKIDWKKRLSEIAEHESIQHLVLIVNCRESYDKVSKTLDKLYAQSIDAKEITSKHFDKALEKVPPSVDKEIEKTYENMRGALSSARAKQMQEERPVYMG